MVGKNNTALKGIIISNASTGVIKTEAVRYELSTRDAVLMVHP